MKQKFLALTALVVLTACEEPPRDDAAPRPRPVGWSTVEPATLHEVRYLPGVVRPVERAALSFEVSGRVQDVDFEIGDHFDKGDVLARLDPSTFRLTLSERRAELAEVEATLDEAQSNFERQSKLFEQGWIARAAFDRALAERDTTARRLERLRATVALAEESLADTELFAPYSGTIAQRHIEPAQQVSAGQSAFDIQGNSGGVEIEVSVPETLVGQLDREASHRVRFPSMPALELGGRIRDIGTDASRANAFTVTLDVDDAPSDMRTGLTAEVALRLGAEVHEEGILRVPVAAIVTGRDDVTEVYAIDEDAGVARAIPVQVRRYVGDAAFVTGDLSAGTRIVSRGATLVEDGQRVRLMNDGPERYNP